MNDTIFSGLPADMWIIVRVWKDGKRQPVAALRTDIVDVQAFVDSLNNGDPRAIAGEYIFVYEKRKS